MLTSTMSAPIPSTMRAASAIVTGSPPKIWIDTGRSSSVKSAYSRVRSMPRTSPSELTISLTTSPQPPVRHFDHRALANQRAGIILELGVEQQANVVEFDVGNRRGPAFNRDDVHHAGALEHGKCVRRIEPREAVSREQWPVDLLLA